MSVGAVINTHKWDTDLVHTLQQNSFLGKGTFLPLCDELPDEEDEYQWNAIENGFLRTDGEIIEKVVQPSYIRKR